MTEIKDGAFNMGISVWISICVFVCFWLWGNFTKGRRQFQTNLHVIEEGLRKMQEDIELRQREKSIGCVEDVEDISEFLKKFYEEGTFEEKQEGVETVPILEEEEEKVIEKGNEENTEDKKCV